MERERLRGTFWVIQSASCRKFVLCHCVFVSSILDSNLVSRPDLFLGSEDQSFMKRALGAWPSSRPPMQPSSVTFYALRRFVEPFYIGPISTLCWVAQVAQSLGFWRSWVLSTPVCGFREVRMHKYRGDVFVGKALSEKRRASFMERECIWRVVNRSLVKCLTS